MSRNVAIVDYSTDNLRRVSPSGLNMASHNDGRDIKQTVIVKK